MKGQPTRLASAFLLILIGLTVTTMASGQDRWSESQDSVLIGPVQRGPQGKGAATPGYATDRVFVKLRESAILASSMSTAVKRGTSVGGPETGLISLDAISRDIGVTAIRRATPSVANLDLDMELGVSRWFLFQVPSGIDAVKVASRYADDPTVEAATPDRKAFPAVTPNDPFYPDHWGHNNTGQMLDYCWGCGGHDNGNPVGLPGFDADAESGWGGIQGYGSSSVIIAILDSGVDVGHPDLDQVAGFDYGSSDADPDDDCTDPEVVGHGTACAGVAAAIADNGIGVVGAAGGCRIMPLKVADDAGVMYFSAIQNALYHAADNGAAIASMSFGAYIANDPLTDDAIAYAYNSDVTLFAATSNENEDIVTYPANHDFVIGIGAASPCGDRKRSSSNPAELNPGVLPDPNGFTCDGERWWGSNYGTNVPDAAGAVDFLGPTILPTTDIVGMDGYDTGDYYMWFSGTSCATPYAAGVAALIKSAQPTFGPDEIRQQMVRLARDVVNVESGVGWDRFSGYGLVVIDDDVIGPGFSDFFPTLATSGTSFRISCDITDPSGVYDDGTGSAGQGVYLLWDNDGELIVDANEALMSWKSGDTYETDSAIPSQTEGVPFVYEVAAYDNDSDDGNTLDRAQQKSGVKSIQIGASQSGLLAIEIVPIYPSGYPFKPGERAEFHFYVRDPASGDALIDTDFQSLWWSPPGVFITPIDHLGTGHYYTLGYTMSTALYTWTFTVEKEGYGLSSAAFSQAVGNVQGYEPVQIQSLTVDPNDFCPGVQNLNVIYSVSKSCVGDLRVMHLPDSSLVRNLLTDHSFPAGADTILWDGRDEGGAYVDRDDMFYLELDVRAMESWGNLGTFGPELQDPTGMKFRNNGWVYVTDMDYPDRCAVTVYDENRSFRKEIGTCGTDPGQFTGIQDLAFDDGGNYYYVYDSAWDGRIQKFEAASDDFVTSGTNYNASTPAALAFGGSGDLYLGGYGGVWRIDQSSLSPTLVVDLSAGPPTKAGTLTPGHVCGLAVDSKGRIYCGLLNYNDVLVYSPSGEFLTSFTFVNDGSDWAMDIRSGRWLYVRAELSIRVYDTEDVAAGPIGSFNLYDSADMGIAVNDVGNVVTTVDDNYEGRWLRDLSSFALQRLVFTSAVGGVADSVSKGDLGLEPGLGIPAPQPTRGSLNVRYSLSVAGPVSLILYDVDGREINRLIDSTAGAGCASVRIHLVDADGRGLPAGIYFLRLGAQGRVFTRKVILVK